MNTAPKPHRLRLAAAATALTCLITACTGGEEVGEATVSRELGGFAPVSVRADQLVSPDNKAGGGVVGGNPGYTAEDSAEGVPTRSGETPADGETAVAAPEGRKVIQRASITVEAESTETLYARIVEEVERSGGYVESAEQHAGDGREDQPRIDITVRIPADALSTTLRVITEEADRVVEQTQAGQDVTEEYVDLEARIENLKVLEEELRELLADARESGTYKEPRQLLDIYDEIARVRGEIESLQARLDALTNLTSLATLHVSIWPSPKVAPVVADDGWSPGAAIRKAAAYLVTNLQRLGTWLIHFAVAGIPLLLIYLGVPALAGWVIWRRWQRKAKSGASENTEAGQASEAEAAEEETETA